MPELPPQPFDQLGRAGARLGERLVHTCAQHGGECVHLRNGRSSLGGFHSPSEPKKLSRVCDGSVPTLQRSRHVIDVTHCRHVVASAYGERSCPRSKQPALESAEALPTLEIIWQQDATAEALHARTQTARATAGRQIDAAELVRLAGQPPGDLELGGTALAAFALVELAHRSIAEGLVHPYLEHDNGAWHAFWGATLDGSVQETLTQIAGALPAASASAFGGDRNAVVHDLYPVLVDQIARDRLRAEGVRLTAPRGARRPAAVESFLEGLTAADRVAAAPLRLRRAPKPARALDRNGARPPLGHALEARPPPRRAG